VTTQNRSYENQLSSDDSFEWFTMTHVIARPRNQSMRRSREVEGSFGRADCTSASLASRMPGASHAFHV
jgi:hypothetical protein